MSTKTIELELQEVISKNLPAQVGESLKIRLKQADELEQNSVEQERTINNLQKEVVRLNECIKSHNEITLRERTVAEREETVRVRENTADIAELKYQLQAEKDKSQWAREIGSSLVRNTIYRKSILDSENQAPYSVPNGNGCITTVYPSPICKSLNETQTEE